jgi:hypothetical protein
MGRTKKAKAVDTLIIPSKPKLNSAKSPPLREIHRIVLTDLDTNTEEIRAVDGPGTQTDPSKPCTEDDSLSAIDDFPLDIDDTPVPLSAPSRTEQVSHIRCLALAINSDGYLRKSAYCKISRTNICTPLRRFYSHNPPT